jgi:hypothetical protein
MTVGQTSFPALSVVLVTPGQFTILRRTVRFLRSQTIYERLELIIVAPTEAAVSDRRPDETACFHAIKVVPVGSITDVDKAAAYGIAVASAPVVALVEDHVYPEPGWAEAILEAHKGPWAAVGSTILNPTPESRLSWANLMATYGRWTEPVERGQAKEISRHNVSFKKPVLEPYGDELVRFLGRTGGLLEDLQSKGHAFFLEPNARIYHASPSRLSTTIALRFKAGRVYAAARAAKGQWPFTRRLVYALGGPLIPLVRFYRIQREFFWNGRLRKRAPRVYLALMFVLILDGLGQTFGYAFGAGKAEKRLASFETDRLRHLTPSDQRALVE